MPLSRARAALSQVFGYDDFRPGQDEVIGAVLAGEDVLAVLTEWPDFRELDFARVAESIGGRHVVDARNLLDREAIKALGFSYDGIGRS